MKLSDINQVYFFKNNFHLKGLFKILLGIAIIEFSIMFFLDQLALPEFWANSLDTFLITLSVGFLNHVFILQPWQSHIKDQSYILLSSIAEGLVIQNERGEITYFNDAACSILGLTDDQLLGRTSVDPRWKSIKENGQPFLGHEHPAMVAISTQQPQKNVVMGVHKPTGELRWIHINSVPHVSSANKNEITVFTSFADITDEVQLRKSMQDTFNKMDIVTKAVGYGVWEWDLKTNHLSWDPLMYQVFDIEAKNFTNDYDAFSKTLMPEDAEAVSLQLKATFEKKKSIFESVFRIINSKGSIRYIKAVAQCYYDSDNTPLKLTGANWDITHEIESQKSLENERANATHAAKMASLGEMAGGLAHEINNPLSTIKGRAAQLLRIIESEPSMQSTKSKDYIDVIINTSDRIARIVSGLKNFSRNAEKDPMIKTSMSKVLDDTISLCQEKLRAHRVKLELDFDEKLFLMSRPTQLSQVLLNIINNAYDAVCNKSDSWIKIIAKQNQDFIEIKIIDSGSGIPQPIADKIMQPFFTTKEVGKGTGLGLSISKGIIEDHGGQLYIESQSSNTCFVIKIPSLNKLSDQVA